LLTILSLLKEIFQHYFIVIIFAFKLENFALLFLINAINKTHKELEYIA